MEGTARAFSAWEGPFMPRKPYLDGQAPVIAGKHRRPRSGHKTSHGAGRRCVSSSRSVSGFRVIGTAAMFRV